ncbi:MetS family NSS transporter small subunit [Risungbinella massiliensis]|nr:MetS family NSS transporter small subunit [Risungbinella massiliensis]
MSISAWIMLILGATLLWGGLAYFLFHAYRANQPK